LIAKKPKAKHEFVVYSSFTGPSLVCNDGWKLRSYLSKNVFELYYLPNDFREETNLSAKFPVKFEELKNKLLDACEGNFKNGLFGGY
jgi:hypothetical protein